MLVQAYRSSLKRWMRRLAIVGTLMMAGFFWLAFIQENAELLFFGWSVLLVLFLGTFVIVSVYHVVVAYLASKERPT